jgi:hypothetical protein
VAGGFGRGDAILGEQQTDDLLGRFGAQFRSDSEEGVGATVEGGGEVEGGGGGARDSGRGMVLPGGLARSGAPSPVRS